ncbi:PDZ/DHR/GLGF domain protein [Thiothrix nivea DSM 5205]|uniref:PDZ/DHR/GLGF domain protein n=2 Tax=Thiothrix nivea TaxID=1031 RepID=A0A656H9S2_THINJ|nr:type II secretion system protein N [Thiothrix nivea]EIJ33681.1 PDZ/DHR/GLGF domain protein [Thiothrix nivea DSM 5205]
MNKIGLILLAFLLSACGDGGVDNAATDTGTTSAAVPGMGLTGERANPVLFSNPYPQIPAQCYIETSRGTQNACQYCHTNAAYQAGLGNNNPQAGLEARIGNLQIEYAFAPYETTSPLATVNRWENTLKPETLRQVVAALGIDTTAWDMRTYVRSDNWQTAYNQRPGDPKQWDAGMQSPFRLFPGLDPADLPANSDGFVRSQQAQNGFFSDTEGWLTGWRAINFMPYGIFTPMTGSVSGIYIRLPEKFMQREDGSFELATYAQNLDLLERSIQGRLLPTDSKTYQGMAKSVPVEAGLYPLGTEFAHPLHYVDVRADGTDASISPFPGTRSHRVKEVRYMYKARDWQPSQFRPGEKSEGAGIYGNDAQGWVDNGAGWLLAGYIEDKDGALRPQTREEMTQCIGCHSGITRTEFPTFTSGTGNTVDSTWAMPRKFAGELGWQEMNYLLYKADRHADETAVPGKAGQGDPLNRDLDQGELAYFLDTVVGASLYGDMPQAIENVLSQHIRTANGYSADWPVLDTLSAQGFQQAQALRQQLMREFTAKGGYLETDGSIRGGLLYPPERAALAAAARYRQVVVSQRYNKGKDVFPETPVTFRHFRDPAQPLTRVDGTPYQTGEVITERPVELDNPASLTYRVGNSQTGIDAAHLYPEGNYNPDYLPLLKFPLEFTPAPAGAAQSRPDWQAIPLTRLPLSLKGMLGLPGGQGFAVIEQQGQQFLAQSGKTLSAQPGVQLLEVGERYALLKNGEALEKLELGVATRTDTPVTAPAIAADELEQVDLKAFRDNAAVDPYRLFDAVQPEPVVAGGKLAGYRLAPGADPVLFVKAGLKVGDVLLAVNGVKLESEEQAFKLLEQYAGAIQLSLTLQRGKEEINLPVNFQES